MVSAGNKANRLTLTVNHATRIINHHHNVYAWEFFSAYKKTSARVLRCLDHEQKWKIWECFLSVCNDKNIFTVCYNFRNNSLPFISVKLRLTANIFVILWFCVSFCQSKSCIYFCFWPWALSFQLFLFNCHIFKEVFNLSSIIW